MEDGIVLIDKPAGWTSFDVVAKIRGKIRRRYTAQGIKPTKRQLKVGHAGTLDPFATGLLVILLGDATKKATEFLKLDKVYEAEIIVGKESTTGDPEGEITDVSTEQPTIEAVEAALTRCTGEITQRPPIFSAIKINGQRAYKLARNGKEVEIPERTVMIYSLELLEYAYPSLKIRTHVGSGTYIRSLAVDIGTLLGTGAYCKALRRTRIANWDIADAKTLDNYTVSSRRASTES
jgi:tRNA pseudouridine55 synthase